MTTSGTVVGAIGGIAAGYVLWLRAFSIADEKATVGQWDRRWVARYGRNRGRPS